MLRLPRSSYPKAAFKGRQAQIAAHILPVSLTADALVRVGFWPRSGATASYIQITGNSDTLHADTVVKIYLAVVRGAGGGGGGGGLTSTQVQALINATDLSALQGAVVDTQIPAAITRDTELAAAALEWQDEGMDLTAVTSINLVGAGVAGAVVNGVLTITIAGGGGGMVTDDIYFGTSADATPLGSELTIAAVNGVGTIAAYAGSMHHLIARLATEADIASVLYSDDQSNTNQIGAFAKFASTVVPTGETEAFNAWVSNQALAQAADVTLTVS